MLNIKRTQLLAAIFGGVLCTASIAYADQDELRALAEAKITLIDAIQAAESAEGGEAYEASIDDDSFRPEYEVTLVRDGRIYDVRVDAVSGEIIGVREDIDD